MQGVAANQDRSEAIYMGAELGAVYENPKKIGVPNRLRSSEDYLKAAAKISRPAGKKEANYWPRPILH